MEFQKLISSHEIYGTSKQDILIRHGFENVLENVVIAPWWDHNIFETEFSKVEKVGKKTYNVTGKNFEFSFIEVKNIGASTMLDECLSLGVTKCKKLLFIGSAGAIDEHIKIGNLAIPNYSVNGVGSCRYLNDNFEDDFETKYYPSEKFSKQVENTIKKLNFDNLFSYVNNYSVDTIFAQFPHIEHFKKLGCQTLEMETSALFKCCNLTKIETTALFCISDNTIKSKSLYSGRNEKDEKQRIKTKDEIIPQIIFELFKTKQ